MECTIKKLQKEVISFRDERDWSIFHNPKDLAMQIAIEAGELLEEFLWKEASQGDCECIGRELADIVIGCFYVCEHYNFDLAKIVREKLIINGQKYPVEKCRGRNEKYDRL
jgi:NTP pyrophosphatase (non-canonical NTP hydrolase)